MPQKKTSLPKTDPESNLNPNFFDKFLRKNEKAIGLPKIYPESDLNSNTFDKFGWVILLILIVIGAEYYFWKIEGDKWNAYFSAYERKDYKTAFELLKPLVGQGEASAQNNLGVLYQNGYGVTKDHVEAAKWYRLAAEQGEVLAQYNLGWMYANGDGVKQDYKEAGKWWRLAAAMGDSLAPFYLGGMYADGEGVGQDYVQAHKWFTVAGENGNKKGYQYRDTVEKEMTPTQIAEAQKLAREWMGPDKK